MGICAASQTPAEKQDVTNNKALNGQLYAGYKESSLVHKLLLLGAGESGKSTLFKQLIHIYGKGFVENERKDYAAVIFHNTLLAIKELGKNSQILQQQPGLQDCAMKNPASKNALQSLNEIDEDIEILTATQGSLIKLVWTDEGIQNTFLHRAKFQLLDCSEYFLNQIEEITAKPGWIPSESDVLRSRKRTTGIVENKIVIEANDFIIVDVGGQRNERKKWVHCFQDVTAVIFVAAMSEYDQFLFEDEKVNRLEEALHLFEEHSNSRWFTSVSIILLLNKCDLFKKKITESPLSNFFPDYKGGADYDQGCELITNLFLSKHQQQKKIYAHVTCALDPQLVRTVFNAVKDIVIGGALSTAGLT